MRFPSNHSQRLQVWIALTVTSCISLIAHASTYKENSPAKTWVLAACSISFILSLLSSIAHAIVLEPFVGQTIEGIAGLLVFLIWITSLPVMMRPTENGIAVAAGTGGIANSNLYFFSWASLSCIVYILFHFVYHQARRSESSNDSSLPEIPIKALHWLGLFVSSIILMASAADIHSIINCTSSFISGEEFCRRTSYAVALGVVGIVFSAIVMVVTQRGLLQAVKIEAALSLILTIFFMFGVGFITFGDGPGVVLGNIYFSVWIGFLLVLSLSFQAIHNLRQESLQERTQSRETTFPMEKSPTEP
jgi:hypothetical protein